MSEIDSYIHDQSMASIPKAALGYIDDSPQKSQTYSFDPHEAPKLDWAGKSEAESLTVPIMSIHEHERITPHKVIFTAMKKPQQEQQLSFFPETSPEQMFYERQIAIDAYNHSENWRNRMIAGDSLIIMNSLLQKESMRGSVQMVYIDPPYGIKFGSNFQPFVNKRDVKDKVDEDLTCEPEMIRAFRDTWELGIHSYLTYLRDRLLLVRELLSDSGSVFVQISDENVHFVRCLCDEIFGPENFVAMITFRKKLMPLGGALLERMHDFLVWYAKDKKQVKYHKLFTYKPTGEGTLYTWLELKDGTRRPMTQEEKRSLKNYPKGARPFRSVSLSSAGRTESCVYDFEFNGVTYTCGKSSWKTTREGMKKIIEAGRVMLFDKSPRYILFHDDYPVQALTSLWDDTGGATDKRYVVQTSDKVISRCILMTTDPGDLVLDITCGSGTTAYAAEKWGRRWITCDTSRVAIAIARQRLLTATYDYYRLANPDKGISSGFVYESVPHITLKSIANNEPPDTEILYDRPEKDSSKTRISGPFNIEALPAPVVLSPDEAANYKDETNESAKQSDWREQLLASGIIGRHGEKIMFSSVEMKTGSRYLNAEACTNEETPRKALVCFANESTLMDSRRVYNAYIEASKLAPDFLIFSAFQFDPVASEMINSYNTTQTIQMLTVQMNPDLLTEDLRKKERSSQSFWLVGQPDVELRRTGEKRYRVLVRGFDYFNVKTNEIESGEANNIAMWLLDTNYNDMYMIPSQIFFPMDGEKGGWAKLAVTLQAFIDAELIEHYRGNESIEFEAESGTKIAVKIIDDRGIESMRVLVVE
ncbi:MAG: site-specific DNA-methyltransferase [Synergistaceae bacterium]|nr:site-specific DNA-methyltransferase [Synergistaceae bacterium]MBR0167415.1 site-specific DNA-methyltransferase [Synergistaceae bacterium]